MGQISIRLDPVTEEKLRKNAEEKGMAVAYYIRHLIDLGLKVEEASQNKKSDLNPEDLFKELQLKSCKSIIENLLVTRQIYVLLCKDSQTPPEVILKTLSEKAQAYVDSFSGKDTF